MKPIILNEVNCFNIANWDKGNFGQLLRLFDRNIHS